ncbi:MAG: hypothetical protein ACT4OI_08970 [Methanobacteriota archaeon]
MASPPPTQSPPTPPATGVWPPGWSPTWAPKPPVQANWLTLLGGVIVFVGYILTAVADFAFATLPADATYGQVLGVYVVYAVSAVVVGSGFLLAFYSLAVRRA